MAFDCNVCENDPEWTLSIPKPIFGDPLPGNEPCRSCWADNGSRFTRKPTEEDRLQSENQTLKAELENANSWRPEVDRLNDYLLGVQAERDDLRTRVKLLEGLCQRALTEIENWIDGYGNGTESAGDEAIEQDLENALDGDTP